jgi:hypothetical protein
MVAQFLVVGEPETQKGEAHMKKRIKECHSNLSTSKINMYATSQRYRCYPMPPGIQSSPWDLEL